jgi:hypothetical protein
MIYAIFITLNIILGASSLSSYACCVSTSTSLKPNIDTTQISTDEIIRQLKLYNSFFSLLNKYGIGEPNNELDLLARHINTPRENIIDQLNNIFIPSSNEASIEEKKAKKQEVTQLLITLHLLTKTPNDIRDNKLLGNKLIITVHPDKKTLASYNADLADDDKKTYNSITEILLRNKKENYLTSVVSLLNKREPILYNAQQQLMEKRILDINVGRVTRSAAFNVGYLIGQKLCSPLMSDKKIKAQLEIKFMDAMADSLQTNLLLKRQLHQK